MVVMGSPAQHVGVDTGREIEPLEPAEGLEDLERSEDRGAPNAQPASAGFSQQIAGREVALPVRNHCRQRPARFGQSMAGTLQGADEALGIHNSTIPQLRLRLNFLGGRYGLPLAA